MKLDRLLKINKPTINWEDPNNCPVCDAKIISRCKCSSNVAHDLSAITKGHGRLCSNGHRLGDNGIYINIKNKNVFFKYYL